MEPATMSDLKDLMKELREELRESIKEAVAEAFGNRKPALEQATTPAASQLLSTDAPASTPTIVGVVPVLAASDASAKPLDIDAMGVVPPTPTTCSTECPRRDATASPSVFTLDTTPASSTATINIVPELTACAIGVVAFDIDANGVAVVTPTRCSTDCLDDNPNEEEDEALPMSCFVFACSQVGGCRKHPWPPPQVMSLTGVYCTALISMEQQFCSQLLFHGNQIEGSGCMTWDPGKLLNHTLLSHKADDQLFGFKNASVQRLLRQLLVDSTEFGIDMTSPKIYGAASQSTDTVAADVSDDYEQQHVSLDKTVVTAKRSLNLIQEEGLVKRAHNQEILTSVDNNTFEQDKYARQSFNKGNPGSNSHLCVVSTPRCMPPLLEEIPCELCDTLLPIETISHVIIINGTSWLWYNICAVIRMDPRTRAADWRKCSCQHLILPEPYNLLLDYLENCSVPTYLQLDAVCASVVYMFQQRTSQNWELSSFFQQIFEPNGPSIVTYCYGLSSTSGSLTSELTNDYCASVTNFCLPATTSVHDLGSLEIVEHQLLLIHEHVNELAGSFPHEKWWSTRDLIYTTHGQRKFYEHHVWDLEYAVVGGIPIPVKWQQTMQIMGLSMHWWFLSQEEFKGSGRLEFQNNLVVFAVDSSAKRWNGLKSHDVDVWSESLVPSAAICVFCAVLSGNQSMMLHDRLTQGMPHQAVQLEEWTFSENHVLEHAPSPDKLQKAMHNLNMLVWWQLLSQGKFKWSDRGVSGSRQITRAVDYQSEVKLKLATSCFCAVVASLFEWPLSSGAEFVAGAMAISIKRVCSARGNRTDKRTIKLTARFSIMECTSPEVSELAGMVYKAQQLSHIYSPLYRLVEQQLSLPELDEDSRMHEHLVIAEHRGWCYLHCDCTCALPNCSVAAWVPYNIGEVHKSWEPGGVTIPTSNVGTSKILSWMIASKESCVCSNEEHFQGGRDAAIFEQGFVDHKCYISLDQHYVDNDRAVLGGVGLGSSRISRRGGVRSLS